MEATEKGLTVVYIWRRERKIKMAAKPLYLHHDTLNVNLGLPIATVSFIKNTYKMGKLWGSTSDS